MRALCAHVAEWESKVEQRMSDLSCRHLLVFGGMFDPPHVGHLALPILAAEQLEADRIAWVPAGRPPHRRGPVASGAHRMRMLQLALRDVPHACVLADELARAEAGETSHTARTLEGIAERLPSLARMTLLIGADQVLAFHAWRAPDAIRALADLAVMGRPFDGGHETDVDRHAAWWEAQRLHLPSIEISSSQIRDRLADGRTAAGLVPRAVERYARRYALYG
jgi:nicotinate-nucleotide adenylyltransferase